MQSQSESNEPAATPTSRKVVVLVVVAGIAATCCFFAAGGMTFVWMFLAYQTDETDSAFKISGIIVNESGARIPDVTIHVTTGRNTRMGTWSEYKDQSVKASGTFQIQRSGCSSVSLIFLATDDKYDGEKMEFNRGGKYENLRVVLRRRSSGRAPATSASVPHLRAEAD